MDVLFFINDMGIGGAQSVVRLLVKSLADRGYRVGIVTEEPILPWGSNPLPSSVMRFSYKELTVQQQERLFLRSVFGNLARIIAIRRHIKKQKSPLLVSFLTQTNIVVILASFFLKARIVVSERGNMAVEPLPWQWRILRRLTYFRADLVTTNNEDSYHILRAFVPSRQLQILPNPLPNLQLTMNEREAPEHDKAILYVGRLSYEKGVHLLITAYSSMVAHNPSCPPLIIVGDGPSRLDLEETAGAMGLQRKITWAGEQHNVAQYYSDALFLVVPSLREGLPNVVLEALSFHLPIIITDCSMAIQTYVQDGYNGFVVPKNDSGSLATAMIQLHSDEELRRRFSVSARILSKKLATDNALAKWFAAFELPESRN